jgi:hypothetical protein
MEATVRTLESGYKTARKPHQCALCCEQIDTGARFHRYVGVEGGELSSSAQHAECTTLMIGCDDDTDWCPEYFFEVLQEARDRHPERLRGRWKP